MTTADLATAAVTAAFTAPLLLIAVYSVTAPWWRTQAGRAVVTAMVAVSLALLPPFLHRATSGQCDPGAVQGFSVFQAVTWAVLAVVVARMTWMIAVTQWRAARKKEGS